MSKSNTYFAGSGYAPVAIHGRTWRSAVMLCLDPPQAYQRVLNKAVMVIIVDIDEVTMALVVDIDGKTMAQSLHKHANIAVWV